MSIFSSLPENAAPGDRARRRAALCLLLALVVTPPTIAVFLKLYSFWVNLASLGETAFTLLGILSAALLSFAPIISAAGWLLALWYGVESVFMPRERHTPTTDIIIIGIGLVAWSLPTLGVLISAALTPRLPGEFPVYLQSVGYKLIAAAVLAWLTWRYWHGKLHRKNPANE